MARPRAVPTPQARPGDVPIVASEELATSSWANTVANGINGIADDIYGASQLEIPWSAIVGIPPTLPTSLGPVVPAQAYGLAPADGAGPAAAAAEHSHGTPPLPTAAEIGTVVSVESPATVKGGRRIFVGTTEPTGPLEGDIWIKA